MASQVPVQSESGDSGWNRLVGTKTSKAGLAAPFVETWPDLTGKSLRVAVGELREIDATWEILGAGAVVAQNPPAGSPITEDRACRLTLR